MDLGTRVYLFGDRRCWATVVSPPRNAGIDGTVVAVRRDDDGTVDEVSIVHVRAAR